MRECNRETCFVPDTGCDLGHTDISQCPTWGSQIPAAPTPPEKTDEMMLPWSGSALGIADLGFVSGARRPFIVGIAGSQNAGKTTILGAWYLLLGRGAVDIANRTFAGSYSFAGWEAVSGAMRWEPGQPAGFPPHTSSRGGRAPGMLHMSFWDANDSKSKDYLFTDAPGEWFQKWAVNGDSSEGIGARWVANRADVILIVADREALAGERMGTTRNGLKLLARRIANERRKQPVALVWTKSDVIISQEIETAIRDSVIGLMPDAVEFSVSVVANESGDSNNGLGLIELLKWILAARRAAVDLPPVAGGREDPLFMFGERSN